MTKEEKIAREEELKTALTQLCQQYGFEALKLVLDKSALINPLAGGQADSVNDTLVVDVEMPEYMEILYHEFRHYWQYKHYYDVYYWWMRSSNRAFYKQYYDYVFCSIEEDARIFGKTRGQKNREDLLDFYSVEQLEDFKQNRSQIEYAEAYLTEILNL